MLKESKHWLIALVLCSSAVMAMPAEESVNDYWIRLSQLDQELDALGLVYVRKIDTGFLYAEDSSFTYLELDLPFADGEFAMLKTEYSELRKWVDDNRAMRPVPLAFDW